MSIKLSDDQLNAKIDQIYQYSTFKNAATASEIDPNANVTSQNVATLISDLHKDENVQIKRAIVSKKLEQLYGKQVADEYNRQILNHEIYVHDESHPTMPYCVAISMYPFLLNGLKDLGGDSSAPKHLDSFCGGFVNLIFCLASQFAGACATVEFLMCFDYFARKDFGDNYLETNLDFIHNKFQEVVYCLNQPAGARSYQCPFWNISIFDKYYFEGLFGEFIFPDEQGTTPKWETLSKLQKEFMRWFNDERTRKILTFPVVTAASLTENGKCKDEEFNDFLCEQMAEGNSFFNYMSDDVDSLSSCCRLRNALQDNTFSFSLGAGGVMSGSMNVITINFNRLVQNADRNHIELNQAISDQLEKLYKYQSATLSYYKDLYNMNMLPAYSGNFISMKKQYLTIGINGMLEAAESRGLKPTNNDDYKKFIQDCLKTIYDKNKEKRQEVICELTFAVGSQKYKMFDTHPVDVKLESGETQTVTLREALELNCQIDEASLEPFKI